MFGTLGFVLKYRPNSGRTSFTSNINTRSTAINCKLGHTS